MSAYKKRAQSGYSAGKMYKNESNRAERAFAKDYIHRSPLISSDTERFELKTEIYLDDCDRVCFDNMAKEYPSLLPSELSKLRSKKKKRKIKAKDIRNRIQHLEKNLVFAQNYPHPWAERIKIRYQKEIAELQSSLQKILQQK
jgi:hypothetical protein